MIRATLIAAVLCLTACAAPKERCLLQAQPDLTEIDALIAETEANLDRGYALEQGPISLTAAMPWSRVRSVPWASRFAPAARREFALATSRILPGGRLPSTRTPRRAN